MFKTDLIYRRRKLERIGIVHSCQAWHQDLSLRMPEYTSAARAQGFNKVVVSKNCKTNFTSLQRGYIMQMKQE